MSPRRAMSNGRCVVDARRIAAAAGTVASFVVAVGVGLMVAPAEGGAFSWSSAAGSNWSVGTNWSPVGAPQAAGDSVLIDAAGSPYTITLDVNPTLDAFTMNSADATLFMDGRTMTVSGASTITSGTVQLRSSAWAGAGTLSNAGTLIVEGGSSINNLSNTGTMTVRGVSGLNTGLTVNSPFSNSGTMNFTSTVFASANLAVGGTGVFTNSAAGTVNVFAGAGGQRSFNAVLANAGALNVSGDLSLDRASGLHTISGAVTIDAGRTLTVNGNSQKFTLTGGTLAVDGELAVNGATFRLAGGAISGAGTVRITGGRLEMGGGGSGTVVTRGNGTMSGSIVSGQTVVVRGESGLNTSINTDGAFSNVGTLTFTSTVSATANMTVGGSGTMSNFGTLNILSGAGGQRQYDWNLSNQAAGKVEIDADAVFSGPSRSHTTAGQFHIASGRSLTISGNSQTFSLTNGTMDVDGLFDVVSATFFFNGGTLTGDGTARVTNGRVSLGNGGAGTIVTRGTGSMVGNIKANQSVLVRGESGYNTSITADDSFSNAGTLTFGSTVFAASNMAINKGGTLTNNGTVGVLSGAGGQRQYNWNLANSGTGTVSIDAAAVFDGTNRAHSNSGQFSVAGGASLTINGNNQTFTQQGGTLNVDGLFDAASSTLVLNGGSITGSGTTRVTSGRLSLGTKATAGTVVQRGTGTLAGSISAGLSVLVRGESGFNTTITADDSFTNAGSLTFTSTVFAASNMTVNGGGTLTNTGTLSFISGSGGSRQYNWNLANAGSGTVGVSTDAVFVGAGRAHSNAGAFNVSSGASLTISGGPQTFSQNAGTMTVDGLFDVVASTFEFNGGTITGTGTTRVTNGRLALGTLPGGSGTVVHRGTGTMVGDIRSGTTVLVRGESGLNTTIAADDSFGNAGTLLFSSTVFATSNMTVGGSRTLTNTGTVDFQSGAGGQRQYDWNLTNDAAGTVSVNSDVAFVGTGRTHSSAGIFQVSDGRSLTVNGGGQTFTLGGGSLNVGSGGVFDVVGSTLAFNGGAIGGAGTVRVTNGRLDHGAAGTGTVVHRGTGTMGGDVPAGHRVVVRGESGLNTSITADNSFVNAGTIDLTSTVFATGNLTVGGGRVLTNTGTFNILNGAGGQRAVSAVLRNSGLVDSSTTASIGSNGAQHTNAGNLRVTSGTLTITGDSFTNQAGGLVSGNGRLDVTALQAAGLRNDGSVQPGLSVGSLTIAGRLTSGDTGELGIEIAGLGSGQFDVLTVTGPVTLAGRVAVSLLPGYLPTIGDTFRVFNYASRTGSFAQVVTVLGNPGVTFDAQYNGSFMNLVVTAVPAPGGVASLLLLGAVAARRKR